MKKSLKLVFACVLLAGYTASSQSIYSFQGLGNINHQGMPNNVGMGELGIGAPTIWHVNTQNPANLVYNNFSTFQLGMELESRSFTGDSISGSDFDGRLRFMAYAFPIKPGKWSSAFGILPFTTVGYNTFTEGTVDGDPDVAKIINEKGRGGLTHFYWANGIALTKSLYVGFRANYTFGSIDKESQITIGGEDVDTNTISFEDQTSYSDVNIYFGASYRVKFSETSNLNLGLTYAPQSTMKETSEQVLRRLSGLGATIESQEVSSLSSTFGLPQSIGAGIAYQKLNKFLVGVDVESQMWEESSGPQGTFSNFSKVVIGGYWIPDYDNVNSYLKRATYRFGFNYLQIPYIVNGQTINDFGINFGASLPVSGFSSIDLALKLGQLGTSSNGLIKESYYKVVIGATINDRWFIKRRYD